MALQLIEGYENQRAPEGMGYYSRAGGVWQPGRTGGYAFRGTWGASSGEGVANAWANLPTPTNAMCVGVGIQMTGIAATSRDPGTVKFLQLREGSTQHLGVGLSAEGFLGIYRGDGTLLADTDVSIDVTVWNHYQLRAVIHDSAGEAALYLNGSKLIEVLGVDTRNGGAAGIVERVHVEAFSDYGTGDLFVDDWYITDTTGPAPFNGVLGDCKVEVLRPNGNGAASDFVGSDGNSTDNWQLVDDMNSTSDYVGSNVPGARDLYELSEPTGTDLGDVMAVVVDVLAAKSDAGDAPGNLRALMRSVGGVDESHLLAIPAQLTTSYQWFRTPVVTADPAGDPWTIARLAGLQLGVEIEVEPA